MVICTAFGRKFRVSLDNLTGEGGDGTSLKTMFLLKFNVIFQVKLNYHVMQHIY
jgi:elongation factor P hydroxylase